MSNSRTKSSIFNMIASGGYQLVVLLLSFVARTIFIKVLGEDLLSINGLFSNILSVLSLAELGVSTAIIYSMYKPVADNNEIKISQLINFYKKLYNSIALIVLTVGIALIPFLEYVIKLEKPVENLKMYYILFLLNTVFSYLFVYKTSVIIVHQKDYITKIYGSIFTMISFILQIIVLISFKNYSLYLGVSIICALLNNIFCARKAEKMYPYIKEKHELPKSEKKSIWVSIKSMFYYKVGGVILNNTDNILISVMISTTMIGFCSNYILIVEAVKKVTSLFFSSLQASIGNLNAKSDGEKQYSVFKILNMFSFWIYGFSSVCLCLLLQDFILLWLGSGFVLDINIVYVIVFNFYLTGVLYPIWIFRETIGLFNDTKHIMIFASGLNIIFSLILGKYFGVVGILLATGIARILTNLWYEPYKLYKIYFKKNISKYFISQIVQAIQIIFIIIVLKIGFNMVLIPNIYINFVIKMIISVIISNIYFYLLVRNTCEFKYLKENIISKIRKRKKV